MKVCLTRRLRSATRQVTEFHMADDIIGVVGNAVSLGPGT